MKTLIIGDIHGCDSELYALLDKASLNASDHIIAIGDICDRGPGSVRVWQFFYNNPQARSLMGNHEYKHVRAARGELRLAASQKISRQQFMDAGVDYAEVVADMATFPIYIELPEAILCHGYLDPALPLAEQPISVVTGTMGGDAYLQKQYGRTPWYEQYNWDKPVVVGHHNYSGTAKPFVYRDRVYGIDTDCHEGKALTGLILPDFKLITIPAARNYWVEVRQKYAHHLQGPVKPQRLNWAQLEKWIEQAEKRPLADPVRVTELAQMKKLMAQAEALLPPIYAWVMSELELILAKIERVQPDFGALTAGEQGRLFHLQLTAYPKASWKLFHKARQGKLLLAEMSGLMGSPRQTVAMAEMIWPVAKELREGKVTEYRQPDSS